MKYIVNDIENLLLLDSIGAFNCICNKYNSISITNIRINDFSIQMQKKILNLICKYEGFIEVEVDLDFYNFERKYNTVFAELGDGDKSSIYFAKTNDKTIITSSILIINTANVLNIKTINIGDFINLFVKEKSVIDYFNNFKIA